MADTLELLERKTFMVAFMCFACLLTFLCVCKRLARMISQQLPHAASATQKPW